MTMYKVDDGFLDQIDALLDSVMEAAVHSDTLDGAGIVLVNLEKFEMMKQLASELCDAMEDGFPEYGKDDDGDEETTEECTDPGDDDHTVVHLDPDCDGSGFVAY